MSALPRRAVWRRRVLGALRAAGLDAVRVAPGSILLSRRGRDWQAVDKAFAHYLVHRHVAGILELYRVNCVIDVGANRGQYARELRHAGYAGHIASFEPVPDDYERLEAAARGDGRWSVHPYALGREDGVTEINAVPGTLSSLLEPTRFGARRYERLRDPRTVEVPVRRLDGLLDEVLAPVAAPRPYLKLDTQGFDLEVFAGLGDRVGAFVGMQSELALMRIYEGMPRLPEALGTYEAAGFEVTGLYPVSRQSRTARVLEFDCVMVRPAALRDGVGGGGGR
jgi:FkbM family methyltransferase